MARKGGGFGLFAEATGGTTAAAAAAAAGGGGGAGGFGLASETEEYYGGGGGGAAAVPPPPVQAFAAAPASGGGGSGFGLLAEAQNELLHDDDDDDEFVHAARATAQAPRQPTRAATMPNQRLASPSRQTTTDATLTTHSQSHSQAFAVEPPQRAFRFEPRRTRIDWRLLHGVDPDDVVRDMNIDALEGVLDTLTFGDIGADDVRLFTETNFRKLFRLSQLTVEYLLHVQDTLQTRNARMHKDVSAARAHTESLRAQGRACKDSAAQYRRELRAAKKQLRLYEVLVAMRGRVPNDEIELIRKGAAGKTAEAMRDAAAAEAAKEADDMREQLTSSRKIADAAERRAQTLETELARAREEASASRSAEEAQRNEVKRLSAELAAARAAASSSQSQEEELAKATKAHAEALAAVRTSLGEQVSTLVKENADLNVQLAQAQAAAASAAKGGKGDAAAAAAAAATAADAERRASDAESRVGELESKLSDASRHRADLEQKLRKLAAELARLREIKDVPAGDDDGTPKWAALALMSTEEKETELNVLRGEIVALRSSLRRVEDEKTGFVQRLAVAEKTAADRGMIVKTRAAQLDASIEQDTSAGKKPPPPPPPSASASASATATASASQSTPTLTEDYLRELFNKIDKDGSGEINKRELIIALRKDDAVSSALKLPARIRQEDGTRDTFEQVFQSIDRSEDNLINWSEFISFFNRSGNVSVKTVSGENKKKKTTTAAAAAAAAATTTKVSGAEPSTVKAPQSAKGLPPPAEAEVPRSPSNKRLLNRTSVRTPSASPKKPEPDLSPRALMKSQEEAQLLFEKAGEIPQLSATTLSAFEERMKHRPFVDPSTGAMKDISSLKSSQEFNVVGDAPSRYNHDLSAVVDTMLDASTYFEASLSDQLTSFGIDPNAKTLSDHEYARVMKELEQRRQQRYAKISPLERDRQEYERLTALRHILTVAQERERQGAFAQVDDSEDFSTRFGKHVRGPDDIRSPGVSASVDKSMLVPKPAIAPTSVAAGTIVPPPPPLQPPSAALSAVPEKVSTNDDELYEEDFEDDSVPTVVTRVVVPSPSVRSSMATDVTGSYASETISALGSPSTSDFGRSSVESLKTIRQSTSSLPEEPAAAPIQRRGLPVSQSATLPRQHEVRSSWGEEESAADAADASNVGGRSDETDEVTAVTSFDLSADSDPSPRERDPQPSSRAAAPPPRRLVPLAKSSESADTSTSLDEVETIEL